MVCQLSFTSWETNKKHNHLLKSRFSGSAKSWSQCLWSSDDQWSHMSACCLVVSWSDESNWPTGLSSSNNLAPLVHTEVITNYPIAERVEVLRSSEGLDHVRYCFCHILLSKQVTDSPRFKEWGNRLHFLIKLCHMEAIFAIFDNGLP